MITQTIDNLKEVLSNVCYTPHGMRGGFKMIGLLPEGRSQEDSCILVSPYSSIDITGWVSVGRWVMIGSRVNILTHSHTLSGVTPLLLAEEEFKEDFTKPTDKVICDDVWIHESTILPQCNYIANGVIIGIGSVVTKPITEKFSIWAGNPAKKIGHR